MRDWPLYNSVYHVSCPLSIVGGQLFCQIKSYEALFSGVGLTSTHLPFILMAESLKKLENQLNCSICLETYTNPKQLQCHHVYCQQCLVKLVIQDQQGQLSLTCPNCRKVTPVPASGVAGLQAAFRVNKLLEIVEEHKKVKVATANPEEAESATTSPTPCENVTVGCPEHGGKEVDLYCETCGETICWKCIMQGSKHHSHKYQELNKTFERYKEEIMSMLEPIEKQITTIEKALAQLDGHCDRISDQRAAIEADIHDTIARLHETLDTRKTELIGQLHQLTQAKLKSLAEQRDRIETTQAQLSSCLLFMRENLKTSNQGEALMMKSTTVRQVKELTTTFQPDMLEPNTKADMIFSAITDFSAECQNYGKVCVAGSLDPSKYCAKGNGVNTAVVGEMSTVVLQTVNFSSQPCIISMSSISCELTSEITSTRVRGSVEKRGKSQYDISYQPTIKGGHQLHIKVEGQHIRESPFAVTARFPVEMLKTPILTIGGVNGPTGVAINRRGEVVVTENGSLSVFSTSGERIQSFGKLESDCEQFQQPHGVAVDGKDNIFVVDRGNHRIQKFTAQGKFLIAVGTKGHGPLQFNLPYGIAYSASNDKVYVGDRNHCIQILNSDLGYLGTFGEKGSGKGNFNSPCHIACDSTGNVYVADCNNHRIQVFTAEGKFLKILWRRGAGKGELRQPRGVAIDSSGRIYVTEMGEHKEEHHRVSVFTSKGLFVTSFGQWGKTPGQFRHPQGLAVDNSGVVYVCDSYNQRVQLF